MMSITTVIGVDVSKDSLYVVCYSHEGELATSRSLPYDQQGLADLFALASEHGIRHIAFEATGGYERRLQTAVQVAGLVPLRLEPKSVQLLAQSFKRVEKTDALDCVKIAKAALIHQPKPCHPLSDSEICFRQVYDWRQQLVEDCTRLKNQMEKRQHESFSPMREWFEEQEKQQLEQRQAQLKVANQKLRELVKQDDELAVNVTRLRTMPGVGEVVAWGLVAQMPELGKLEPKACAKLAGLAPLAKQSGKFDGQRRTRASRLGVKSALWMAALTAARMPGPLKKFYEKLINKGKHASVARVAVMRRMLRALNGMLRDGKDYDAELLRDRTEPVEAAVQPPPVQAKGRAKRAKSS